jgi:hypothetical protein
MKYEYTAHNPSFRGEPSLSLVAQSNDDERGKFLLWLADHLNKEYCKIQMELKNIYIDIDN